jgi:hypothetical protein
VRLNRPNYRKFIIAIVLCLVSTRLVMAVDPPLTKDQMKQFLVSGKVVASKHTSKGVTDPWRLTLTDGTTTHEGVFQAIDVHKATMQFADGTTEINFIDSYKYNIAAYQISELLGLDDMIPVYVERKWNGQVGSISWLVSVKFDEQDRLKRKISSPDTDAWNKQMYKIRVFDELVYDNDPNLTNVLIGEDWRIWRVDFSRAFRLSKDVKSTANLVKCDRQLLEKLKTLTESDVLQKTKNYLTKPEVQAVMARRDKIVAYFQKLIAQKGESEVLY